MSIDAFSDMSIDAFSDMSIGAFSDVSIDAFSDVSLWSVVHEVGRARTCAHATVHPPGVEGRAERLVTGAGATRR